MYNGINLMEDFDNISFKTTRAIIDEYSNKEVMGHKYYEELEYLHFSMLQKYFKIMIEQRDKAAYELKKIYVSSDFFKS